MLRASTLLLVLTLGGSPAASAFCVTWCASHPATTDTGCHDEMNGMSAAIAADSAATCGALFSATPFVREEARGVTAAPQPLLTPQPVDVALPELIRPTSVHSNSQAMDGRPLPTVTLRI